MCLLMTADRNKVRVAISMNPDLHEWLQARIGPDKRFGSMTHAIETAVTRMKYGGRMGRSKP